jgi:hypothetical protein
VRGVGAVLVIGLLTLLSCSDGGGGSGSGGSGGGPGTGGGGAAGTGAGGTGGSGPPVDCTQFANPAPTVQQQLSSDPAPTPAAGDIQGGTYYLTSVTYHQMTGPCSPRTFRRTMYVDATSTTTGTSREVEEDTNLGVTYWDWYTYFTEGTLQQLRQLPTCPMSFMTYRSYTATATTLTFFDPPSGPCGHGVFVFTKQ